MDTASTSSGKNRIFNKEILVRTYVLYFMPGHKCTRQRETTTLQYTESAVLQPINYIMFMQTQLMLHGIYL